MSFEERNWCNNASARGGSFIKAFAEACLRADEDNIVILTPALHTLMTKYPKYSEE